MRRSTNPGGVRYRQSLQEMLHIVPLKRAIRIPGPNIHLMYARKQDAPEGFMRILDAITNSAATPHLETKKDNLLPSEKKDGTASGGGASPSDTPGGSTEPTQE